MRTQGNKIIITIAIVSILIAIGGGIFAYIYLYTDILKTEQQLFAKYLNEDIKQIEQIININKFNEMQNKLKESKYEENMSLFMEENSSEDVVEVTLEIQRDPITTKTYANSKLIIPDAETVGIEYINQDDIYSIRFTNAVQEFISIQNTNLKELISKFEVDEETLSKIPNIIDFEKYSFSQLNFTEEEIKTELTQYANLLYNNISKEKYSKNKNVVITINGSTVTTKAYTLTLNKQDIKQLSLKLLEEIKQDEIILGKLQILDEKLQNFSEESIKDNFIQSIQEKIDILNKKVIEEESNITITIYVIDGQTVRIKIEENFENILLDTLSVEGKEKINLKHTNIDEYNNQTSQEITILKENENKLNIKTITIEGEEQQEANYIIELMKSEKNINLNVISENINNKITLTRNINIVDEINYKQELNETNNIILNDLSKEQLDIVMNFLGEQLPKKYLNTLQKALTNIGHIILKSPSVNDVIQTVPPIYDNQEISRFNSRFEAYNGKNLTTDKMNQLLNEVVTNNKQEIQKGSTNLISLSGDIRLEPTATEVQTLESGFEYKIECEYNAFGYVSNILVTKEEIDTSENTGSTDIEENTTNGLNTLN